MTIQTIDNSSIRAHGAIEPTALSDPKQFAGALAAATSDARALHEEARDAAAQFVSVALVQPLLAQLRAGSMAPEDGPFAPTQVENRFGPMRDALLSDRIVRSAKFPLVDAVARRVLGDPAAFPAEMKGVSIHA